MYPKPNQLKRITVILSVTILTGLVAWLGSMPVKAQMTRLPASHDAFIDLNNPQSRYDGQRLEVTYSHFLEDFKPTRRSLLQFDLSRTTGQIDQARLVIEVVENNLPSEATLNLALYGLTNAREKNAMTYDTRPGGDVLLETTSITGGYVGPLKFGEAGAEQTLGQHLAKARQGQGLVTFELRFEGGAGKLGFAGNALFEDSEGSADGVNGNEPFLELQTEAVDTTGWQRLFLPTLFKDAP